MNVRYNAFIVLSISSMLYTVIWRWLALTTTLVSFAYYYYYRSISFPFSTSHPLSIPFSGTDFSLFSLRNWNNTIHNLEKWNENEENWRGKKYPKYKINFTVKLFEFVPRTQNIHSYICLSTHNRFHFIPFQHCIFTIHYFLLLLRIVFYTVFESLDYY